MPNSRVLNLVFPSSGCGNNGCFEVKVLQYPEVSLWIYRNISRQIATSHFWYHHKMDFKLEGYLMISMGLPLFL